MTDQQQSKTVGYRSKMNPVLKKNFAIFPVLDCDSLQAYPGGGVTDLLLRLLEQGVKGERKKEKPKDETEMSWKPEIIEIDAPPLSKELEMGWSYSIQKFYKTDVE